jgi:hypothetical protein
MSNSIWISTFRAADRTATAVDFASHVRTWIVHKYLPLRQASKLLARDASFGRHQVSHRTAQQWLRRNTTPSLESIEILAARHQDLREKLAAERERLNAAIADSLVRDAARNCRDASSV